MSDKEPQTETEILSADEQKVREMCLSLKKIEAPKDFDFKLKARIASSNAGDFRPRFGFAFRYALPVLVMIFVLGFLAYNSGMFSFSKNNAAIAQSSPETTNSSLPQNTLVSTSSPPQEQINDNSVISNSSPTLPKVPDNEIAGNNLKNSKIEKKREEKKDNSGGSSELKSVKPPLIVQPNFNSNTSPQKPQNVEKVTLFSVKEILEQLGINAAFENGKWIVKSVVDNGLAKSSGIKENDIVEAIDNQTISNEPVSAKALNFKNITVMRNGGKLEIKLRNKQ